MGWFTENSTVQRALAAYADSSATHKAIAAIVLVILVQRVLSKPQKHNLFPVWATIEVGVASYVLRGHGWGRRIYSSIRKYGGSLFGISKAHQVFVHLPDLDRVMTQSVHALNADPVQYTLFTRVFGAPDEIELKTNLERSWKDLIAPLERLFLNDKNSAAAVERANIPQLANSFVTFSSDPAQMNRWEMSADIQVVKPNLLGNPGSVEANLQSLTRDFGACMAIPLLYGKDFLERCPQLLDDFWKFDNDLFPLLMIGIPPWAPFKMVKEGRAARSRMHQQLAALYRRIDQYQKGEPVDFGADMSDVSIVPLERNKVYQKNHWSFPERGVADFTVLWGQNGNTQPTLFWLLTYIYSTPDLLDRVREDIAPYIQLSETDPLEVTSIDLPGLFRNCQLLKACLFETYRMSNEPASIRYVERPVTIKDGEFKHELKPGTFITVPHALVNSDPTVFADPDTFVPERFLETDAEGKMVARYSRLRPWGVGPSMCKGRTFAEKELLALGAAILSLWSIDPVGGTWRLPAMIPGTGVKKPVKDIRVSITRRTL